MRFGFVSQRGEWSADPGHTSSLTTKHTGMRKFRIDQDFLIEHWHMIYIMPVVFFAEIYFE